MFLTNDDFRSHAFICGCICLGTYVYMYTYVYMSGSVYMYVCMSAIFTLMSGKMYTWKYMEMRVEGYRYL